MPRAASKVPTRPAGLFTSTCWPDGATRRAGVGLIWEEGLPFHDDAVGCDVGTGTDVGSVEGNGSVAKGGSRTDGDLIDFEYPILEGVGLKNGRDGCIIGAGNLVRTQHLGKAPRECNSLAEFHPHQAPKNLQPTRALKGHS